MRSLVAVVIVVLAGAARADDKTYELKLVPKAEKGKEERIEVEASVGKASGAEYETDSLKGVLKRTIKAVGDDGLPSKEQLSLESGQFTHSTQHEGGSSSSTRHLNGAWSYAVSRDNKTRSART